MSYDLSIAKALHVLSFPTLDKLCKQPLRIKHCTHLDLADDL
jgi:hypothetical protein